MIGRIQLSVTWLSGEQYPTFLLHPRVTVSIPHILHVGWSWHSILLHLEIGWTTRRVPGSITNLAVFLGPLSHVSRDF